MSKIKVNRFGQRVRPLIIISLIFLLICGVAYPLLITGASQIFVPYQANGELVYYNGSTVGSHLIAQNFTQPEFFHDAVGPASGVDPDITLQQAYAQVPRISRSTGIPSGSLIALVNANVNPIPKLFGNPYVNVLALNLALIKAYPSVYTFVE